MNEKGDRRVVFFLIASVVCVLLALVAPGEFRGVCLGVAGVYAVLAIATALDRRSRQRSTSGQHRP
ncbi:MAG: hypothetical protein QOG64_235 [Acidimicrobiaceae bacterium]|jgi:hypothetical protein|nr:hypothetical protein [Acidimicrobiaceae bacterium]